jgi:hypothetical protein
MWEKDKTYVTCVAPGLYEIQLGFFSRRKPVVRACAYYNDVYLTCT